jgi:hypothetical protein
MTEPSKLLDQLLDIKRLAESEDDRGYDPYVLLDEIAVIIHEMIPEVCRIDPAIKALLEGAPPLPIIIEVLGGVVQDVLNVPPGIDYEIRDYDNPNETSEKRRPA